MEAVVAAAPADHHLKSAVAALLPPGLSHRHPWVIVGLQQVVAQASGLDMEQAPVVPVSGSLPTATAVPPPPAPDGTTGAPATAVSTGNGLLAAASASLSSTSTLPSAALGSCSAWSEEEFVAAQAVLAKEATRRARPGPYSGRAPAPAADKDELELFGSDGEQSRG